MLLVQHPVELSKVPYPTTLVEESSVAMSVVTIAPSRVRHHFLIVEVSVATRVAYAEIVKVPSTFPLLGVFQATDGETDSASTGLTVVEVRETIRRSKTVKNLVFRWVLTTQKSTPECCAH